MTEKKKKRQTTQTASYRQRQSAALWETIATTDRETQPPLEQQNSPQEETQSAGKWPPSLGEKAPQTLQTSEHTHSDTEAGERGSKKARKTEEEEEKEKKKSEKREKTREDKSKVQTYCVLFQGKHVVVEEPVQLLVGVVDAQLFKAVRLSVRKQMHQSISHTYSTTASLYLHSNPGFRHSKTKTNKQKKRRRRRRKKETGGGGRHSYLLHYQCQVSRLG